MIYKRTKLSRRRIIVGSCPTPSPSSVSKLPFFLNLPVSESPDELIGGRMGEGVGGGAKP
jgi:hypothetical protein